MDSIHYISHRGNVYKHNNLPSTIDTLNKYECIDMIEIDIIYENNEFVVNHSYNNGGGISLYIWIKEILVLKKYMWLDIKNENVFEITFDVNKFDEYLLNINNEINLIPWIFIGCQYKVLYDKLKNGKFLKKLNLIYDAIYAHHYIPIYLNKITQYDYNKIIKPIIYKDICNNISVTNIIAIDSDFFNSDNEIQKFIYEIPSYYTYIIIYSFNYIKNFKHFDYQKIIYMYNFD